MALHMLGVLFLWLIRVAIARSRGVNEREGGNDGLVETKACSAILKKNGTYSRRTGSARFLFTPVLGEQKSPHFT